MKLLFIKTGKHTDTDTLLKQWISLIERLLSLHKIKSAD